MTDSLETSEAEALLPDHFPDAGEKVEPPVSISVPANALRELLQAVVGPGHHIRELQATRQVSKLMGEPNCIDVLVDAFNAAPAGEPEPAAELQRLDAENTQLRSDVSRLQFEAVVAEREAAVLRLFKHNAEIRIAGLQRVAGAALKGTP